MAEPQGNTDDYGLATLGRTWTPEGMRNGEGAAEFMDSVADAAAHALNVYLMIERYAPIILNPSRCSDYDVNRILELNGIARDARLSNDQARRLAVVATHLRAWRGAFRSMRSLVNALTGSPVMIRSWLSMRVVVDVSDWNMVALPPETYADYTFVYIQEGQFTNYRDALVGDYLDSLAKTVLDTVDQVASGVVTTWRDGLTQWVSTGVPVLVASPVLNEYECIEVGPDADLTVSQWLSCSNAVAPPSSGDEARATIWAYTVGATTGDYWEMHVFSTVAEYDGSGDAYVARFYVGVGAQARIYRVVGGVYTLIGTHTFDMPNGTDYRRFDLSLSYQSTKTRLRLHVDGNPGFVFDDLTVSGRPAGNYLHFGLNTATFTTGKMRVAGVVQHNLN